MSVLADPCGPGKGCGVAAGGMHPVRRDLRNRPHHEAALGRIEDAFGRERSVRNAPRTLDLDLIAYGRLSGDLQGLILPHPRAAERRFVMGPIAEIAPAWTHPHGGAASDLAASTSVGADARPT